MDKEIKEQLLLFSLEFGNNAEFWCPVGHDKRVYAAAFHNASGMWLEGRGFSRLEAIEDLRKQFKRMSQNGQ